MREPLATATNGISRRAVLAGLPLLVMGCAAPSVLADDESIERVIYRHSGQTALTLFTMKNVGTDIGAHTGLMVSASQRVIFDPAGTFSHPSLAERNDVIYGISPTVLEFYRTYHARSTYFVVEQYLEVDPQIAETALRLVMDYGPVPKAACTRATAHVLRESIGPGYFRPTLFPDNLLWQFSKVPGVQTFEHPEYDSDNKNEAVAAFDAQLAAQAAGRSG
jgi:hypothetical protein